MRLPRSLASFESRSFKVSTSGVLFNTVNEELSDLISISVSFFS